MSTPSLQSALVRILKSDRKSVGIGFLVTPKHVITYAHVVNTALGRGQEASEHPDSAAEVLLDFPLVAEDQPVRAEILHWFPVRKDVAGKPADIAVSVVVLDEQRFADCRVRLFGMGI